MKRMILGCFWTQGSLYVIRHIQSKGVYVRIAGTTVGYKAGLCTKSGKYVMRGIT